MSNQSWYQNVVTQKNTGVLKNTFTTAKSILNAQNLFPLYPNQITQGFRLRIRAAYAISNIVTTPGTITFQVMLGSVVVWSSSPIQLNATAHTLLPAVLELDLVCQVENTTVGGAVAQFMGVGILTGQMFTMTAGQVDGVNSEALIVVPVGVTPALGTAFDSTISQTLDHWVGFSISNAGNGVQLVDYSVDLAN